MRCSLRALYSLEGKLILQYAHWQRALKCDKLFSRIRLLNTMCSIRATHLLHEVKPVASPNARMCVCVSLWKRQAMTKGNSQNTNLWLPTAIWSSARLSHSSPKGFLRIITKKEEYIVECFASAGNSMQCALRRHGSIGIQNLWI